MLDHTVGTILSREGVQQGDVIATFLFSLVFQPVLHRIYDRAHALCSTIQVFAILDDITMTAPINLLQTVYTICTEELLHINIRTVPRKSHILVQEHEMSLIPADLHRDINIHSDGITLLGTAIGSNEYINSLLQGKLTE